MTFMEIREEAGSAPNVQTDAEEHLLKYGQLPFTDIKATFIWEKQRANVASYVDIPTSPAEIAQATRNLSKQVARNTFAHLVIDEFGNPDIALVTPQTLRAKNPLDQKNIPTSFQITLERTRQSIWFQSLAKFARDGALSPLAARQLAGAGLRSLGIDSRDTDPFTAIEKLQDSFRHANERVRGRAPIVGRTAEGKTIVLGTGHVREQQQAVGIAARRTSEQTRRKTIRAKALYTLTAGLTIGSMVMSACSRATSVGTGEIPRTGTPTAGIEEASQPWSTLLVKDQDGREYTIQNEKTIIIDKLHGYTAEENETVLKTEKTYQFSSVALEATDGESAGKTAILLQELNADGGIDAELVLMKKTTLANGDTQFSLFSPDGADSGFTLVLQSNGRIILHLEGTDATGNAIVQDYVLDVDSADGSGAPTALPTKSPSVLMNALTALIDLDAGEAHALEPSTPPSTETPTAAPEPTNTPDPLAGAPEGATGKDSKGNYIKTVEENGYTYEFTWDKEQEDWVRPLGKMFVWDNQYSGAFPLQWFMAEGVPGGNIQEIAYQDYVTSDDPNTLSQSINSKIQDRLGLSNEEMVPNLLDNGVTFSYSVDGVSHEVVFDKDTGIKVFIVPPESLEPFVGEGGVSLVTDNISFKLFSKLVGIDKEGELVFVVASPVPLDQLSERWLRVLLFLNVGNFLGRENQTRQALTTKVGILATTSSEIRANGKPTIDIIWNK